MNINWLPFVLGAIYPILDMIICFSVAILLFSHLHLLIPSIVQDSNVFNSM